MTKKLITHITRENVIKGTTEEPPVSLKPEFTGQVFIGTSERVFLGDLNKNTWIENINSSTLDQVNMELTTKIINLDSNKVNVRDFEVEKARIDSFTKLPSGSTTGDAELMDARIGIDGINYPNLGHAIRTQLDNVGINPYVALPFELTPNQYIYYATGSVSTHDSANYMASNFIRLVGVGDITIKT